MTGPIICPDCGFEELTDDFVCYYCDDVYVEQVEKKSPYFIRSTETAGVNGKKSKPLWLLGVASLIVIALLAVATYPVLKTRKVRSLDSIKSQLHVSDRANKFKVDQDPASGVATISLTEENVKLGVNTDHPFEVTLLFDCISDDAGLTTTPAHFSVSVLSADETWRFLDMNQFDIKSDEDVFTLDQTKKDSWVDGKKIYEYMTYDLSRTAMEQIASSKETHIRIGEFDGQLSESQRQAIRTFLDATALERNQK